jgi:hypothetical protein
MAKRFLKRWLRLFLLPIAALVCLPPAAHAECQANAPGMLGLFLPGRSLGDAVHALWAGASGRRDAPGQDLQPVIVLDQDMSRLNASIWGLYWITRYGARLYEVIDKLDDKERGPAMTYYDRWHKSQLTGSSIEALKVVDQVRADLALSKALPSVMKADIEEHLQRVVRDLAGCTSP